MNGRRIASILGTVAVTTIAAVASYDHMHELALSAGQSPALAAMLPLSVDGLVLVATVALGDGRRHRGSAWVALAVGVAASLAANVMAADASPVSRVVSAWPAVALLLTVEVLARSGRTPATATPATATPATAGQSAAGLVTSLPPARPPVMPAGARALPIVARHAVRGTSPRPSARPTGTAARVAALVADRPTATAAEVMAALNVSARTARRHLASARMATA
ncbi:Protein of unknown function [Asanoa hainanensis]|uniref:DUF2637 domain-containing protein n=1 Tax=Asanoa hainanensis TaxID=560556 RepID=A0A239FWH2_9ACTN|nr:DUF2637 domain-containing protein [Asanoa hainanensis]SNS61239.1 Protein of unknown function [Asanoa hainanensis]